MKVTTIIAKREDYTIETYSLDELQEGQRTFEGLEDEEIAVLGGILAKLRDNGRRIGIRYIKNDNPEKIITVYHKDRPCSFTKSNRPNCCYMLTDEQVANLRNLAGTREFVWEDLNLIAAMLRPEDRDIKMQLSEMLKKLITFVSDSNLNTKVPHEFHYSKNGINGVNLEIIKE